MLLDGWSTMAQSKAFQFIKTINSQPSERSTCISSPCSSTQEWTSHTNSGPSSPGFQQDGVAILVGGIGDPYGMRLRRVRWNRVNAEDELAEDTGSDAASWRSRVVNGRAGANWLVGCKPGSTFKRAPGANRMGDGRLPETLVMVTEENESDAG